MNDHLKANHDLIEATRERAAQYGTILTEADADHAKRIDGAQSTLLDALAHTYALLRTFDYHHDEWCHAASATGDLLTHLGAVPENKAFDRPVLALVKVLFASVKHRSQLTRWAQVLEFLKPSDEEYERMHNATPAMWREFFMTKFNEHGSIKAVLRAQSKAKAEARRAADEVEKPKREKAEAKRARQREKDRAAFLSKSATTITAPDLGECVVVMLRRDGDGYALYRLSDDADVVDALVMRACGWGNEAVP